MKLVETMVPRVDVPSKACCEAKSKRDGAEFKKVAFDFLHPTSPKDVSWAQRLAFICLMFRAVFFMILQYLWKKCTAKKDQQKPELKLREIVPGYMYTITYTVMGPNNSIVVRRERKSKDPELMLIQSPPPSEELKSILAGLGTVTVVVEPDSAHDVSSKKLVWEDYSSGDGSKDPVLFITSKESQQGWIAVGNSGKWIDGLLDENNDDVVQQVRERFGWTKSIPVGDWLQLWNQFSHVFQAPSEQKEMICTVPCPFVNYRPTSILEKAERFLSGFLGFKLLYHAQFMYCDMEQLEEGHGLSKFIGKLINLKPDILVCQHGEPIFGGTNCLQELHHIRYGMDVTSSIYPQKCIVPES